MTHLLSVWSPNHDQMSPAQLPFIKPSVIVTVSCKFLRDGMYDIVLPFQSWQTMNQRDKGESN